MAKAQALVPSKGSALITTDVDMDELAQDAQGKAGLGMSHEREDNLIPYLVVLQDNSPQVKKREASYIEGAEPGMIMRTDIKKIYESAFFQPCHFSKKWVEWVPRDLGGGGGAGFAGVHEFKPADAFQKPDAPNKWALKNGNDLVETRYHIGNLILPDEGRIDPCVIGMTSSGHTVSRSWTSLQNQFRIPGTMDVAPAWFRYYNLTTVVRKNAKGSWFVWSPEDRGWLSKAVRDAGYALYQQVASGEKKAAEPMEDGDDADNGEI